APRLPELPQLLDDVDREIRRYGEADADRTARWRDDGRVDADHIAMQVEERPAGIAAIDGSVGLDEIVIGPRLNVAIARRHDADRHAAAESERVADRHDPVADADAVGIPELDLGKFLRRRVDLQDREVGLRVAADQLRLK